MFLTCTIVNMVGLFNRTLFKVWQEPERLHVVCKVWFVN